MRQLSQDEIDAAFAGQSRPVSGDSAPPYDFRKPDRIPKSQLRAISFLHENLVRSLTSSLSAYLRSFVSGNLISVEQIPYRSFVEALPENTCMVPLTLLPRAGNAILEINPALIFPILELLLGGKKTSALNKSRELTEMEHHLLENLFRLFAHDIEQTWRGVSQIECRVTSAETGRQLLRALNPSEAVVAIGMEFRIDHHVGMINLAIPSILVKGMVQKFDRKWASGAETSAEGQQKTLHALRRAQVVVEPKVTSSLTVREILTVNEGSTLVLDHALATPVITTANGKIKFTGRIVIENGERAFLVEEIIEPQKAVAAR
jgi:flagellar motor switch protein FliM